ncbi:MAG: hypothetical protein KF853_11735 [Rhodocyclaceae bacterium]|nr:hypothetical protein [Cryobacterium sp.]MBX3677683.1 hypothetical protein [Rhodocyclaceae bacterium]
MRNTRYSPDELYATFRDAHDVVTAREFFNSPAHKKTQELYCAARFAQALSRVRDCWVLVSDVDEQTDADFHLEVAGHLLPFQITEVQIPGRRRGDEYKQDMLPRTTLESWDSGTEQGAIWIREAVQKKLDRYGGNVAELNLLVYANFQAYEHDFEEMCHVSKDAASKFATVWVVNGNGACCIKGSATLGGARPWLFSEPT